MEIQSTVYYMWVVVAAIAVLLLFINHKLRTYDPLTKPTGIVLVVIMAFQTLTNMCREKTNEELAEKLPPYIATVAVYIFISNIAGLFSLESPTSNFSVTLTLAAITCVLIEVFAIKYNGVKNYVKGLFQPLAPFVIINLISKVSTLASLSLRLFGNIISGSILMSILYQLLEIISSTLFPFIGEFNIVGVIIAPVLHFYFDLFSGGMQTFIFVTLSISFIGKELPQED